MGKLTKIVGAAGAVAAGVLLSKKENRDIVKQEVKQAMNDPKGYSTKLLDKALRRRNKPESELGMPKDPQDAKMVSEGALTSVNYYNKHQEEEEKQTAQ